MKEIRKKKGYFAYFFSLINDSDNGSEIIQPASCSQSYIGDAAINTWYKVLSKILNTFSGVAALIFVARLLGELQKWVKTFFFVKFFFSIPAGHNGS